ncbi:NYN domain-containing protein [Treponema saccharophilum]|uniref:NYN domain-containing protein n=1 Tax=Treponema saccharophilum DSM 2985 TaxID=907348 RepID=H7EL83_9SPIR|nr:NYN domain-containing protein [Treponema saccharophilum]EIC01615.1 hypothetical protein TresaDRAFT_2004 [Treponema saccharophilum DSM 2985]BDC96992.1 hypothetical protein TRSA_20910 [Treponema saccharophilum]
MENKFRNIAVLIDAENVSSKKVEKAFEKIEKFGKVTLKRLYGNFKEKKVLEYEDLCKKKSIRTVHQFSCASKKNSSDILLVIDAMDLLYKQIYDCFVIIASDSDYTALCQRIFEDGFSVIGFGEKEKTTESFRKSCTEFIFLDDFSESSMNKVIPTKDEDAVDKIHELLFDFWSENKKKDDFAEINSASKFIRKNITFKSAGYKGIKEFLNSFPAKYEIDKESGKLYKYNLDCEGKKEKINKEPSIKSDDEKNHSYIHEAYEKSKKGENKFVLTSTIGAYIKKEKKFQIKGLEAFLKKFPDKYKLKNDEKNAKMMKCLD